MNDERFLKDWLKDSTDSTADANSAADRVLAHVPDTPQRRRWLPWQPARRPKPDEPNGRTRLMFSPIQAITAGALAFALGGVLLMARPFGAEPAQVPPGAEADAGIAPITVEPFTATWNWSGIAEPGNVEFEERMTVRKDLGRAYRFEPAEVSDSRFDGSLVWTNNEISYPHDGGTTVQMGAARIETDEGAWQEYPLPTLNFDRGTSDGPDTVSRAFVGEGAYDGLTAYVLDTWTEDDTEWEIAWEGVVISDELPDAPTPFYPQE